MEGEGLRRKVERMGLRRRSGKGEAEVEVWKGRG